MSHKPTVEELHSNKYNVPELGEIYLEILDTSGTFEFPAMRRLSIEKGDAFILVYSVEDAASWEEVVHLRKLILDEKSEQSRQRAATKRRQLEGSGANCAWPSQSLAGGLHQQHLPRNHATRLSSKLSGAGRRTASSPALKSEATRRRLSVHQLPENVAPVAVAALAPSVAAKCRRQSSLDDLNDKARRRLLLVREQVQSQPESPAAGFGQAPAATLQSPFEAPKTPIVVVANKCDLDATEFAVDQFEAARLVRDEWVCISAAAPTSFSPSAQLTLRPRAINVTETGRFVRRVLRQGRDKRRQGLQGALAAGARAGSAESVRYQRPSAAAPVASGAQAPATSAKLPRALGCRRRG